MHFLFSPFLDPSSKQNDTCMIFKLQKLVGEKIQSTLHVIALHVTQKFDFLVMQVRKEFGSLDKYLWGFVNHKPITTNYKSCRKIPIKTSKSETISKDLVRRGFRFVGPTVIHSFMQAAGLTNDHLVSCPRHLHCSSLN